MLERTAAPIIAEPFIPNWEVNVARQKQSKLGIQLEKAAVTAGKELGSIVGRLEKQARTLAKRRDALKGKARQQTAAWARKASRTLDQLAKDLGKARSKKR